MTRATHKKKFKQLNSPAFHRLINQILKNTVIWPLDIKGHLRSFQTFFSYENKKKDIWYLFALVSTKNKYFLAKICMYGKRYHKYILKSQRICSEIRVICLMKLHLKMLLIFRIMKTYCTTIDKRIFKITK